MGAAFNPQKITRGGKKFYDDIRRERACRDKVRHSTMTLAEEARDRMQEKTGDQFNAYFCMHCHYYHIGRDHRAMGEVGYIHEERKSNEQLTISR